MVKKPQSQRLSLSPQGKKRLLSLPKESRMEVLVYHKPNKTEPKIKNIPTEIQAVWAEHTNVHISPCVLWAFPNDSIPPGLEENEHASPGQVWGYVPGTDPDNRAPEKMIFYSPTSKLPKGFERGGIWTFPLVQRDVSHLKDHETAFLNVGKTVAQEEMDISGTWKLLYKNDGSDKPIGPGMKSRKSKDEPMEIFVKQLDGTVFPLTVKPSNDIDTIKNKIEKKRKIPRNEQRLRFEKEPLSDDDKTLRDYNIKDKDTIELCPMQIKVTTPDKVWTFHLDVEPDDTIEDVKKKLENKANIPVPEQTLFFDGEELDDKPTLDDYDIDHGDTLILDPMRITVKHWDGSSVTLEVDPNDLIEDIKYRVQEEMDVPKKDQHLTFEGKPLKKDKRSLRKYKIPNKGILHLEPMKINVETWDGKIIPLVVEPDDTIEDVKKQVETLTDIPVPDQTLVFDGEELEDDPTLKDYNIVHGDTLKLVEGPMKINVETPDGDIIPLIVEPTDTIEDVKKQVKDESGIPVSDQRLHFGGDELDDEPTLDDYNIVHGDTLTLDPMQITVKHWDGTSVTLDVEPNDTIDDVKSRVTDAIDMPKKDQRLAFNGKPLKKDGKTLRQYNIPNKGVLDLLPMQIKVRTPDGEIIPIDVEPSDTIRDVKLDVKDMTGIPLPYQTLSIDGEELDNGPTLDDYNIKHGDILDLDPMTIFVRKVDGKKVELVVLPTDTIADVKEMVEHKEGIPVEEQNLKFNDEDLEDSPALQDYDIRDGDILDLAPMEVIVKHWNNSQHTFLVEPTFTIDTIKDMIVKKKKVPRNDQVLNFGNVPLDEDEYTLRDYNIKHKDVIQMVKPEHMRTPETRKKSYLPENWREEVEKKYGTVKTTTYRTNYSGENDDHFLQGKIREENTDFLFSEKTQQVLESPGKWVYED